MRINTKKVIHKKTGQKARILTYAPTYPHYPQKVFNNLWIDLWMDYQKSIFVKNDEMHENPLFFQKSA
jgi:hypothetical protein